MTSWLEFVPSALPCDGRLASTLPVKAAIGAALAILPSLVWLARPSSDRIALIEHAYVVTSMAVMSVQAAVIAALLLRRSRAVVSSIISVKQPNR